VPLDKLDTGQEIVNTFTRKVKEKCEACDGKGGTNPSICKKCNGTGTIIEHVRHGSIVFESKSACLKCSGTGKIFETICRVCNGKRKKVVNKRYTVKIQATRIE
jgi:molecular chaperone DnaJ